MKNKELGVTEMLVRLFLREKHISKLLLAQEYDFQVFLLLNVRGRELKLYTFYICCSCHKT